jgi:hypothetical protein
MKAAHRKTHRKYMKHYNQMMSGMRGLKELMDSKEFQDMISDPGFEETEEAGYTYGEFKSMVEDQAEYGC